MFGSTALIPLNYDIPFDSVALARSRAYPSESELDLYIPFEPFDHRRRLTNIAVRLQDPFLRCDRNLGWNIDWAVAFIVDHLEQESTDAAETFRNIRIRAATLEREGLVQEIPFRIFNKLDEVLFAGHLKNAVFLDINSQGSDVSGATYTHSGGPNTENKRISIILNRDALEYARVKDIVAILIHHMIHAYFLVACGPQKEDEVDYGRLGHDVHFGKIMLAIKKLSAVHGKELTPLNFGHNSAKIRYFADEYYSSRRRADVEREDKEKWYCSHCHCNVEELPEGEVDKWYNKVCKPMFDQPTCVRSIEVQTYNDQRHELETKRRGLLTSSANSVEFIFKDQPVFVEGTKVEEFLDARKAFEKADSRYLKVHEDVSEKTFLRFLEFLHTGSYRPDPHPLAAAAGLGVERIGPPIIKPQSTATEACLLADVQFVKFGVLMGFDECKGYALDRMNAYGVLYEDPITLLKEIYQGYEPDADLKTWARKFLVRAPDTSSPEYHTASISLTTIDPPNLIKLESEQGLYRARFLDAVDSSGALENDVNKARAELIVAGWYSWSSFLPHNMPRFLADRSMNYSPSPLALGLSHPSPLLLGGAAGSHSYSGIHDITSSLSTFDIERIRDKLHGRERDRDRLRDRERNKMRARRRDDYRELSQDRLKELEQEKTRELEEIKEKARKLERESERSAEARVQLETADFLSKFHARELAELVDENY